MSSALNNDRFRKLLRSHPVQALEVLHQLYYKSLVTIANRLTKDEDAAQDIVQDVFKTIWEKRKELSQFHEKSIERYLVRIVRYKAFSFFKRRKLLRFDDLHFLKNSLKTDQDEPYELEIISEMRKYISTFPKREQQCMFMKIDNNMSLDEIASTLNVSRKMVEKSQTSAMKRLRNWAQDYKNQL